MRFIQGGEVKLSRRGTVVSSIECDGRWTVAAPAEATLLLSTS